MKEFELKYGCNPNQKPSKIYMASGADLPIEILNGRPGYINFLDAFNSYQLVKALKEALVKLIKDEEKRIEMGNASREKALRCFSNEIVNERIYSIYQKALETA